MRRNLYRVSWAFSLCAALAASPLDAFAYVRTVPAGFVQEILVVGLEQPNSFAFLPDGRILFTEQVTGNIRLVTSGFSLSATPVCTVEGVTSGHPEQGLQGIAVDPRWPAFPYVYVMFTRVGSQEWLVRFTATGSLTDPLGTDLSLGDPLILIDNIRDAFGNHNGGTLRFGPDGHLYVTVGDDAHVCAAQRPDSLLGKVLRLDVSRLPAGPGGPVSRALLIPSDNPLSGSDNARLVYAMGLRNPWRMHIDPETGGVFVADVGWETEEEVNEIVPGENYGWPYREGSGPQTEPVACTELPGAMYEEPIVSLSHEIDNYIAIQTATVYRPVPGGSANWPEEYWGNLFVGDYYHSRLRRMVKNAGTWNLADPVTEQPSAEEWASEMFWAVDFLIGPDGSMYWLKAWDDGFRPSSGMIHRIRWIGIAADAPSSRAPTAGLTSAPNPFARHVELAGAFPSGIEVTAAVFDALGRRVRTAAATEREPGRYAWTWDGSNDGGAQARPGIYLVRFRSGTIEHSTRVLRVR